MSSWLVKKIESSSRKEEQSDYIVLLVLLVVILCSDVHSETTLGWLGGVVVRASDL